MDPGSELPTSWEVFEDTIESLGGWKGIGILIIVLYIFVVAVHLYIPRRHKYNADHQRKLQEAFARRRKLNQNKQL